MSAYKRLFLLTAVCGTALHASVVYTLPRWSSDPGFVYPPSARGDSYHDYLCLKPALGYGDFSLACSMNDGITTIATSGSVETDATGSISWWNFD